MAKPSARRRILIIDDEESICDVLAISLRKGGYDVVAATSPRGALDRFKRERFDVVLLDPKTGEMDGIDLLREIKAEKKDAIVIILTADSAWDRPVKAMRLGTYDYVKKPLDTPIDIKDTIARALKFKDTQDGSSKRFDEMLERIGFVIGTTKAMRAVRDLLLRAAPSDSTVLIQGESGVGKELVARALHYGSPRSGKPFIAVNCGALTETLLESELFGHVKGSFTGAVADKAGLAQAAHTGTLFLDEVSEMSPKLQVKVLRLVEEKQFIPVGSVSTRRVDVRFVAATNKNLERAIEQDTFRKDLYYRLAVIPVQIPPLRERPDDIPLLAEFFMAKYTRDMLRDRKKFSPEVKEAMLRQPWPGNIRELENAVQRSITMSDGSVIQVKDLIETDTVSRLDLELRVLGHRPIDESRLDLDATMDEIEASYLRKALEMAGENYTKAAELLNLSHRSFRYKLQRHGIDRNA